MLDYSYLDLPGAATLPKKLRIMRKLSAHLALTPGFVGIQVFRGKAVLTAKEVENCLSVLEAPRSLFGDAVGWGGTKRDEQWALLVQGWPKDDPMNPSDPAYVLEAAVTAHLAAIVGNTDHYGRERGDPLYLLGGDIAGMEIGQGIVRPDNSDSGTSRLAEFFVPLLLELQTDKLNPHI